MIGVRTYRGQPLVALGLILGGWIAMRAMVFDAAAFTPQIASVAGPAIAPPAVPVAGKAVAAVQPVAATATPAGSPGPALSAPVPAWSLAPAPAQPLRAIARARSSDPLPPMVVPVGTSAGHQFMFLSAMASMPLPPVIFIPPATGPDAGERSAAPPPRAERRWSADGWLLLRQGGSGISPGGALLPSLGASQVGAVVRYRLAPGSAHRPALYLRASSALRQPRGEELAAGLALRSLAGVPLAAMAEVRLTQTPGGAHLRPAAALVTELPPAALPGGLRAETYVQAGYVGGAGATPFIDGQARIEAPLANAGKFRLRAGAGAWGGAQQGAARLDIGPTATLAVPLGSGGGRLTADWRFRVAGNAAPASGPALTLSAGF